MQQKPNIIFLFSDQQRWDTVSCYGQPLGASIELTPNLDYLAAEGTRFDRSFTCQPVCGPARACIQTGKYPTELGCHVNDRMLPLSEKTIAKYFHQAGYETAYVGKWHLASQNSFNAGKTDCVDYKTKPIPIEYRGGYEDYWVASDVLEFTSHGYGGYLFDRDGKKQEFTGYRVDATTDFALEYLKAPKEKPFFLFVSYIEPHHQNDHQRYEGPEGSKERFREFCVPGDLEKTAGDWREQMPDYLGCCKSLDENVGRIVDLLKQRGLYENTVLFYTSDHGTHFRTRNNEYKRSCHDASTHVPLIVRGPGFMGGNILEGLTSTIDIAPTLLRCAGIEKPEDMRGTPLQELLAHSDIPIHEEIYIQISESCIGRALRTTEWVYAVEAPEGSDLSNPDSDLYIEKYLYDVKRDPHQRTNLVDDPDYLSVRMKLCEKLLYYIEKEERKTPTIHPLK